MKNLEQITKKTTLNEWIILTNKLGETENVLYDALGDLGHLSNQGDSIVNSFNLSIEKFNREFTSLGIPTTTNVKFEDIVTRVNNLESKLQKLYGVVTDLKTNSKRTFVTAINELHKLFGDSSDLQSTLVDDINKLSTYLDANIYGLNVDTGYEYSMQRAVNNCLHKIGGANLSNLFTTTKVDLISAINEVLFSYNEKILLSGAKKDIIGNIDALVNTKDKTLVNGINSAYKRMGELTGAFTSTSETTVGGVQAVNDLYDEHGDLITLTTINKSSLVSAISECDTWLDMGQWIKSKQQRSFSIGSDTVNGARLGVFGFIKADQYKSTQHLRGNVTGNVFGNVTGSATGTAKSWKFDIKLRLRGAINKDIIFGGGSYKNIKPSDYFKSRTHWEKSGYWYKYKELKKGTYVRKYRVSKDVVTTKSYQVWKSEGHEVETMVTLKRGYWKTESKKIQDKKTFYETRIWNREVSAAGDSTLTLWESDIDGNKLDAIRTGIGAYKKYIFFTDVEYILGEVEDTGGLAGALLEDITGERIPELLIQDNPNFKFINGRLRGLPRWVDSNNWIITPTKTRTKLLWRLSKQIKINQKEKWEDKKVWVDTSRQKKITNWIDTSHFITKTMPIKSSKWSVKTKYMSTDRFVDRQKWVDTSKNVTRQELDVDAVAAVAVSAPKTIKVRINDPSLQRRSPVVHEHGNRYLKLADKPNTTYLYIVACVSAYSGWSTITTTYDLRNDNIGSMVIVRTACHEYVWFKYNSGQSYSAWLQLK